MYIRPASFGKFVRIIKPFLKIHRMLLSVLVLIGSNFRWHYCWCSNPTFISFFCSQIDLNGVTNVRRQDSIRLWQLDWCEDRWIGMEPESDKQTSSQWFSVTESLAAAAAAAQARPIYKFRLYRAFEESVCCLFEDSKPLYLLKYRSTSGWRLA